ncbi:MAG: class I SAM-dependent DNA methyltransferase, partial [Thermoproteota archaeon]
YVDVLEKTPDGLLVIENPERGGEKKTVKTVIAKVDPDHVYPLIRGRDIKKWYVKYDNRYILLPHNSRTGKPIAESELKINWPKTYDYFKQFEEELRNRSIHKLWGRNNPFYSVYDIGGYTFSPYKVVWKNIAGAIIGKAASFQAAVVEPYTDKLLGKKIVIPNVKLMLTPVSDRDEAYYLCAILNSTLIKYVVASYMIETNISTNLYEYIVIPTYERSNNMHKRIAELGKMAHELSAQILDEDKTYLITELKRVEEEIDRAVAALYGLSDMELAEIKRFFAILAAEEVPVEEDILSEENEPKIILPKTVLSSNQAEIITVNIINPSKQQIEVELFLPDGNVKTISTNEMEHFLDVPVNPLPPGIYQLKYTIKVDGQTLKEDSVEIAVTQPRRFRSR